MSIKLEDHEKRQRKLDREMNKTLDDIDQGLSKRGSEILNILRDAPNHPEVKYNAIYFQNHFHTTRITVYRDMKKLKDMDLIEEKQKGGSYRIKKRC